MDKLTGEVGAFLEERRFAVLATINEDGAPQQTVMWYELRDDLIIMNTRVGRLKEKNFNRDPRLSFCVEDEYRYVTITGRAELDYDPERSQDQIKSLAIRYHGPEKGERMSRDLFSKQNRVNIHMTIETIEAHGF